MKNENALLDLVAEKIGPHGRYDAGLARALEVAPPVISKIRHGRLPVAAGMVLRIHLLTDMPIREIKSYVTRGPQMPKRATGVRDELAASRELHNRFTARLMASPAAPEYGGLVAPISLETAKASGFLYGNIEGRCPHCGKYNYDMSPGDNDCLRCGKTITVPGGSK